MANDGAAQVVHPPNPRGHRPSSVSSKFNLSVPAHPYDLILTRPENNSVTLSILAYHPLEGFLAYGTRPGVYSTQTPLRTLQPGIPAELVLNGLQPNTRYYYQLHSRAEGAQFETSPEYTFHTARSPGSSFTFTLTADAHLDEHTSPQVYLQTLTNVRADQPDFHLDLGNLFMTDKHDSREEAARQYLAQRFYLGQIGCTVPLMLALGTHDGERGKDDDGTANSLIAWATRTRICYFPNPIPDAFYTGNKSTDPQGGLFQDYYAWQWGDALLIVLDPFHYSLRQRRGEDGWGWSLGLSQYQWLEQTLAASHAKFKFVFIHNLLSGDQASRGGVEIAPFNEWGGRSQDGTQGFTQHRPGWGAPIHQLLLRYHVAAVFKAHDNFYAHQQLDGIDYQMIPQPSFEGDDRIRDLQAYGYKQGTFLGNSGHVRVTVSPDGIKVAYIKSNVSSAHDRIISSSSVKDVYVMSANVDHPPNIHSGR